MKKLFIVWIALLLALSQAGWTLAQEKAKKEEPAGVSKPATEKSTEAVKSEEAQGKEKAEQGDRVSAKLHIWRMGGMVTAVDPKTKTLSVHQETVYHNRLLKLEVSGKVVKELENLKPGDLVNVWVNGEVITAFNKVI
jgi:hypothetical protein